ncbi:MAG: hypothetical protein CVU56_11665 [Deltaproteobacteria bacterium HGW-Deltaproteobacteria-14]|nr:MAG: hypothetical protein CVU56_11665 [Deltaproteobacteria bacterium HGW-Deltaproteobacteria-14]
MITWLAALLLTAAVGPPPAATPTAPGACPVPEGPVRARTVLADGTAVVARDGALQLADRLVTACDGLPDPFPISVAAFEGELWVGFRAAGLYRFDGHSFSRAEGLPADAVRALAAGPDALWIGTGKSGLWRLSRDGALARFDHRVLGQQEVSALLLDRKGDLQVGAGMYGWWRVRRNKATRIQRNIYVGCFAAMHGKAVPLSPGPECDLGAATSASGLPSSHVAALTWHRGRLYVGTFDRGLAVQGADGRFAGVAGAPPFVNALVSDGDTLWIGTAKGLWRARGDAAPQATPLGLPSEHITGLAVAPDGTLWLATGQGLAAREPGGRVRVLGVAAGLPSRLVYAVAVAEDGAVWAGTAGGAARFGSEGVRVYTQVSGALTHDWVNALLPDGDDGGVLAGTYDAGVVRLTPDGHGVPLAGLEHLWVNPGGLTRIGSGALAVATLGDGLAIVNADGGRLVRGLPSDDVTSVVPAAEGLWVGTRGGLVRIGFATAGPASRRPGGPFGVRNGVVSGADLRPPRPTGGAAACPDRSRAPDSGPRPAVSDATRPCDSVAPP